MKHLLKQELLFSLSLAAGSLLVWGGILPLGITEKGQLSKHQHTSLLNRMVKSSPVMINPATPLQTSPARDPRAERKFTLMALNSLDYQSSLYRLPLTSSGTPEAVTDITCFQVVLSPSTVASVGDYMYVQHLYPAPLIYSDRDAYVYDIFYNDDGWWTSVGEDLIDETAFAKAVAVNPVNNRIYQISDRDGGTELYILDYEGSDFNWTLGKTSVATLEGEWNSIAFDGGGELYGVRLTRVDGGVANSTLCRIDKATGAVTEIGATGEKPYKSDGAVIDPDTGLYYWLVQEKECAPTRLVTLDTATGKPTTVFTFDDNADMFPTSMFAMIQIDPATPNEVTDLSVTFEGMSLTGKLSFKAPVSNHGGTAGGQLTWSVSWDDRYKTGTCTYGDTVEVDVEVDTEDYHSFVVKVTDGELSSAPVSAEAYAGRAVAPSTSPELTYDAEGNKLTVTWKEPDTKYVPGYLDPAGFRYTLTRYPDGEVVADKISELTFTESGAGFSESFTRYWYTLQVFNYDKGSELTHTEALGIGYLTPPFSEDFNDGRRSLAGYPIIDANLDGNTWRTGISTLLIYNTSGTSGQNNDWFVTPPACLERGKTYFIEFDTWARSQSADPEQSYESLRLTVAETPTSDDLFNGKILGDWKVSQGSIDPDHYKVSFSPEKDGMYHFGFWCYTPKFRGCSGLEIDNFKFSTGVADGAPDAPVITSVTRQPNGEYSADVTVRLPEKKMTGEILDGIERLDVFRDGEFVKAFDNPEAGKEVSFTDNIGKSGNYTWTAVAYNEEGAGKYSDPADSFVGQDIAEAASGFNVVETEYGKLHASWDRVTTDRNGVEIDPERITYYLQDGLTGGDIVTGLKETAYDFEPLGRHGVQQWKSYRLYAVNESGMERNRFATSDPIVVGMPVDEYFENYENGYSNSYPDVTLWNENVNGNGIWSQTGLAVPGIGPYSGIRFLTMTGSDLNDAAHLVSTRVDLSKQAHPAFTCMVYNYAMEDDPSQNIIEVEVKAEGDDAWTRVASREIRTLGAKSNFWQPLTVSLEAYAGKTVQIRLTGILKHYSSIHIDDFRIGSIEGSDIALESVSAPATVKPGEKFKASIHVSNRGSLKADSYTVTVEFDGVPETISGSDLPSGALDTFEVELTMPDSYESDVMMIRAKTELEKDAVAGNDIYSLPVYPQITTLPFPENLTGSINEAGIPVLGWEAPAETYNPPVKEDFADGSSFDYTSPFKDWIFVDRDDSPVPNLYLYSIITGLETGVTKTSFFVFDGRGTENQFGDFYKGFGDDKFLSSVGCADRNSDDWAITPELSGKAQVVSFMARGRLNMFGSTFGVYYSTGSTDPDDFIAVEEMSEITLLPGLWTPIYVALPEGARRMAVRSTASTGAMIHIDDFSYVPAITKEIKPDGFRIYRDAAQAGETAYETTTWADCTGEDGNHDYRVTALYDGLGESRPTQTLSLSKSEIGTVAVTDSIRVTAYESGIEVSGCTGNRVLISDMAGRIVYDRKVTGKVWIPVPAGVYVVKVREHAVKVMVR